MKKYVCTICGFIYDEAQGIPAAGIAPGTKWADVAGDWKCPLCGAPKDDFKEQAEESKTDLVDLDENHDDLREMSIAELSALCSNLAKGCQKQYLEEEADLFTQLADYYKSKTPDVPQDSFKDLIGKIEDDLNNNYPKANAVADSQKDRGAKRALVWSEKVTRILNSLLVRYEKEGDKMLEDTKLYVCDICGFIYVGNMPPAICPICKVPSFKIIEIRR